MYTYMHTSIIDMQHRQAYLTFPSVGVVDLCKVYILCISNYLRHPVMIYTSLPTANGPSATVVMINRWQDYINGKIDMA